jgi:hypothetical protein
MLLVIALRNFVMLMFFVKNVSKKKFREEVRLGLQMERNSRKFAHKDSSVEMLFDKVKRLSW